MPRLSPEERAAFLAQRGVVMRIAVVRADGSPLVTPIWFAHEQESIYFTPRAKSEWFACLRRDSRCALSIDEQPLPYRKVLVEGRAELLYDVGDDAEWRDLYRRIANRYVAEDEAEAYVQNTINEPRGLYRLVLADCKVSTWRMPLPGEDAQGIWHQRYFQPHTKF